MRCLTLAVLVTMLTACERKREPAPDSVVVDTAAVKEDDGQPIEDVPELTPADTIITSEDTAAVRARPRGAVSTAGKIVGLFRWPSERWCDGPLTGSVEPVSPANVAAGAVRKAEFCGLRFFGIIRRSEVTNTGNARGYFVLSRGKQACDELARALPLEFRRQYGKTLLGIVIGDEMHSITWANRPARPQDVAEYARYCKEKLVPLPILLRQPANNPWVREIAASQWSGVDYWWAQWNENRGNRRLSDVARQTAWYMDEMAAAARLGDGVILGFNARDCDQQDHNYCTPSEVRAYGANAIRLSKNCVGVLAWWYDPRLFSTAHKAAWKDVVTLARSKAPTTC